MPDIYLMVLIVAAFIFGLAVRLLQRRRRQLAASDTPADVKSFPAPQGKPVPSSDQIATPLTRARVQTALESKGWSYRVDADGDISGRWDETALMWFFIHGEFKEILTIRGVWDIKLPTDQYPDAQTEANDWNRDRLWPKAYIRMDDEGWVRFHTELIVDWEDGVTDAQLLRQIRCAINTTCQLFKHLAERFQPYVPSGSQG